MAVCSRQLRQHLLRSFKGRAYLPQTQAQVDAVLETIWSGGGGRPVPDPQPLEKYFAYVPKLDPQEPATTVTSSANLSERALQFIETIDAQARAARQVDDGDHAVHNRAASRCHELAASAGMIRFEREKWATADMGDSLVVPPQGDERLLVWVRGQRVSRRRLRHEAFLASRLDQMASLLKQLGFSSSAESFRMSPAALELVATGADEGVLAVPARYLRHKVEQRIRRIRSSLKASIRRKIRRLAAWCQALPSSAVGRCRDAFVKHALEPLGIRLRGSLPRPLFRTPPPLRSSPRALEAGETTSPATASATHVREPSGQRSYVDGGGGHHVVGIGESLLRSERTSMYGASAIGEEEADGSSGSDGKLGQKGREEVGAHAGSDDDDDAEEEEVAASRREVYEFVLVERRDSSDGAISSLAFYKDVPRHALALYLPEHSLELASSELFFLFSLVSVGSVMPVYRSLNMALSSPWVAEAVLAALAGSLAWVAHSSLATKKALVKLRVGDQVRGHLAAAGGRECSVVLASLAKEMACNEALLSYYALLLLQGEGKGLGLSEAAARPPSPPPPPGGGSGLPQRGSTFIEQSWGLVGEGTPVETTVQGHEHDHGDDGMLGQGWSEHAERGLLEGDRRLLDVDAGSLLDEGVNEDDRVVLCREQDVAELDQAVRRWLVEVAFPERPNCDALRQCPVVTLATLARLEELGLVERVRERLPTTPAPNGEVTSLVRWRVLPWEKVITRAGTEV